MCELTRLSITLCHACKGIAFFISGSILHSWLVTMTSLGYMNWRRKNSLLMTDKLFLKFDNISARCQHVKDMSMTFPTKFRKDKGKKAIIVRALYGLKSAVWAFQEHLIAGCMQSLIPRLQVLPCWPLLWYKVCTRKGDNGNIESYYLYMLVYVDNILCIH